jgi:hypothetical protein
MMVSPSNFISVLTLEQIADDCVCLFLIVYLVITLCGLGPAEEVVPHLVAT